MTEADWRMKALADFFGATFVRVDEDGEPMTTNDATRTALRAEQGMWEAFAEEERIKQEMAAMGKANDATPREADRAVEPELGLSGTELTGAYEAMMELSMYVGEEEWDSAQRHIRPASRRVSIAAAQAYTVAAYVDSASREETRDE